MANEEKDVEEESEEESETTDWKAKYQELGIKSRERTKALKDKITMYENDPRLKAEVKTDKPDEALLKRLEKLTFKVAGINDVSEVEFFEKWRKDNGYENADIDTVFEKKGFQTELADFRTAKANQQSTSDIKGESGTSGAKNTPEYWIAKATKGADGNLLFSDEMPKELYTKVLDKLESQDPSTSKELKFYNS